MKYSILIVGVVVALFAAVAFAQELRHKEMMAVKRLFKRAASSSTRGSGCTYRFRFKCTKTKPKNVPSHQNVGNDRSNRKVRKIIRKTLRMLSSF